MTGPATAAPGFVKAVAGLLACALALVPVAGRGDPTSPACCDPPWSGLLEELEQRVDELRALADYAESDLRDGLERHFLATLRRRGLSQWAGLPDAGLLALFDAAYLVVFYTGSPTSVERLAQLYRALQGRGSASAEHADKVVRSLMTVRQFDQARDLAQQSGAAVAVPQLIVGEARPGSPRVLRLADPQTLVAESADLEGVRLVIVGAPGCGFFRQAVADLSGDPALDAWIRSNAAILLPPQQPFDPGRLSDWNSAHAGWQLQVPYAVDEWPWIRRWSTPGFYLLVDGVLREHVIGWPDRGRLERLRAMIRTGGGVVDPPG